MDFKDLKALAAACRKAGIKHYRQGDVEFTLTDDAPVSNYKKSQASGTLRPETKIEAVDKDFQSDELSQEALLYWSTGGNPEETEEGNTQ